MPGPRTARRSKWTRARWSRSLGRDHRASIFEGAGPGSRPAAGHITTAGRPAPRRHITSAVEGGGHGTQKTRARLHWRLGGADIPGGSLQAHWRIGATHPGTGRRRGKEASSGKDAAVVQTLQDRSERGAKLAEIGAKLGARARPWTAICEPTETRSETEDGTIR